MPTDRMGPPPGASPPMRMTASRSGSNDPTAYKSAARRCSHGELPSDPQQTAGANQTPKLCKKPVSAFIVAPRAQASRRCETQATLDGKAAKLCYRFGPLTPSARSANLIAGDGTKNGFPGRVEDWRASWPRQTQFDFSNETVGAEPKSFLSVVGFWTIGAEVDNKLLVVDGRRWKQGQPAANVADKARAIYGERYAEFLDNVQVYAYFPYAVAQGIDDFRGGEISRTHRPGCWDPVQSRAERRLFWCGLMRSKTILCCSNTKRASAQASSGSATRQPRAGSGRI